MIQSGIIKMQLYGQDFIYCRRKTSQLELKWTLHNINQEIRLNLKPLGMSRGRRQSKISIKENVVVSFN